MLVDLLSVALRGLSFAAVLQAGGAALFLAVGGRDMPVTRDGILRIMRVAALTGALLLVAQYLLEPARMAGEISGTWNVELQKFLLQSPVALVLALRLGGLLALALALRHDGAGLRHLGVAAAVLIAASFAMTGHTARGPQRWLLGPVLMLHVLVVEFWFGSLLPLMLVAQRESGATAARIVRRFSRCATWTVPLILMAGVFIAARLLPDMAALREPYGIGLLLKMLAFVLLLGFAAANRWRLAPALEHGGAAAAGRLRRSIGAEFLLIIVVLLGTAALTTFWSPQP